MNHVLDYLHGLMDDAEQRMDAVGIPEPCAFCRNGIAHDGKPCKACGANGYVIVERIEARAA